MPVNGLTLEELEDVLYERLGRVFSGVERGPDATARFHVTLGRLRTNQVFLVGEVERVVGAVGVEHLCHDARTSRRKTTEPPQQLPGTDAIPEQTEVVAHQEERIESAEVAAQVRDAELAHVAYAALATDLDGAQGYIHRDDLVALPLQAMSSTRPVHRWAAHWWGSGQSAIGAK